MTSQSSWTLKRLKTIVKACISNHFKKNTIFTMISCNFSNAKSIPKLRDSPLQAEGDNAQNVRRVGSAPNYRGTYLTRIKANKRQLNLLVSEVVGKRQHSHKQGAPAERKDVREWPRDALGLQRPRSYGYLPTLHQPRPCQQPTSHQHTHVRRPHISFFPSIF